MSKGKIVDERMLKWKLIAF